MTNAGKNSLLFARFQNSNTQLIFDLPGIKVKSEAQNSVERRAGNPKSGQRSSRLKLGCFVWLGVGRFIAGLKDFVRPFLHQWQKNAFHARLVCIFFDRGIFYALV